MRRYLERLLNWRSKKTHTPDPAHNDEFKQERTKDHKLKEQKVPHGKYRGKRWFPW